MGWLVASEAVWPNAGVYKFDLLTGDVLARLGEPVAPSALATSLTGDMLVIDRDLAGAKLWVYSAATGALVQGPISTTLPPDQAVFVTHNDPPTWAHSAEMAASEGTELAFVVDASDGDGDAVSVEAIELPPGAAFSAAGGTFVWTPDYESSGAHRAVFRVSDGITDVVYAVAIEVDDVVSVAGPALPTETALLPAAPNPFNPRTSLRWTLSESAEVSLSVHSATGQTVRTLLSDVHYARGAHSTAWDGRDDTGRNVASGVYLIRLQAGATTHVRRVTLVR